jgi:hypothetical protein
MWFTTNNKKQYTLQDANLQFKSYARKNNKKCVEVKAAHVAKFIFNSDSLGLVFFSLNFLAQFLLIS